MKTHTERIRVIAVLLASLAVALCFASCALGGGDGRDVHTMFEGTGTLAPLTAAPTQPPVTTSPVITGAATTASAGDTTADPGTLPPDITTAAPETEPETTVPVEIVTYDYDVVTVNADIGTLGTLKSTKTVRYPKITGLADTAIQDKINTLLVQIADAEFQKSVSNVDEYLTNGVTIRYEVTKTAVTYMGNNLLSVRSEGTVKYSDSADTEKFIYCNIINLSTAKDIKLSNVYSDFGKVMTLFTGGSFSRISGMSGLESNVDRKTMMDQYKYYNLYNIYPETYFTSDSLVIVVEVASQYGYVAEYSVPLTALGGCLALGPTA